MMVQSWRDWRRRAEAAKLGKKDEDIAAAVADFLRALDPKMYAARDWKRGAINGWFNGRVSPTIDQFMALCAALGADPGEILFKQPAMGEIVKSSPSAAKAIKSAAAIGPQPAANSSRARSFKAKQRKLRRAFLR